jgi:DNA-binding response OmpR family regulator
VGVPVAQQERIFDRFSQVPGRSGRSAEGAGIGLALVRGLAAAMGGSVAVTSTPGDGSTFRVALPRRSNWERLMPPQALERLGTSSPDAYLSEAASWVQDDGVHTTLAAAANNTLGRLLLVEDNADMRGYLMRLLSDDGWHVDAVGSVDAALAIGAAPDIIVSDVMLPGLSGIDLVRMIRADEQRRRTPVILLTARFGADAATEGLDAGADDYIVKPFDANELLARVRVHHELSQLREFVLGQAEDRATHAEDEVGNLRHALGSNRQIGVAMGVLMARESLTEAQAFDRLRAASQHRNRKLRDVADEVVLTGRLE